MRVIQQLRAQEMQHAQKSQHAENIKKQHHEERIKFHIFFLFVSYFCLEDFSV